MELEELENIVEGMKTSNTTTNGEYFMIHSDYIYELEKIFKRMKKNQEQREALNKVENIFKELREKIGE